MNDPEGPQDVPVGWERCPGCGRRCLAPVLLPQGCSVLAGSEWLCKYPAAAVNRFGLALHGSVQALTPQSLVGNFGSLGEGAEVLVAPKAVLV